MQTGNKEATVTFVKKKVENEEEERVEGNEKKKEEALVKETMSIHQYQSK